MAQEKGREQSRSEGREPTRTAGREASREQGGPAMQRGGGERLAPSGGLMAPFGGLFGGGLSPWAGNPIRRMFQDLDRFFDVMQRGTGGEGGEMWMPAINVRDTDTEVVVEAEVPGVDPERIAVECTDDMLTIRGESEERREEEGWMTRRSGHFFARAPLPPGVDTEHAQATVRNGVLVIRLPKARAQEQENVRRIPVNAESMRDRAA